MYRKISKNFRTDKQVTTLKELGDLRKKRKSVYLLNRGRLPAAVIINWQGAELLRVFSSGHLYSTKRMTEKEKEAFKVTEKITV